MMVPRSFPYICSMKVTNWGLYPTAEAEVRSFSSPRQAVAETKDWEDFIPRGLGRCYGDSSLSERILDTTHFNRFLDFDPDTGILRCQSGVSFKEIIDVCLPQGWFLPVTPGTKFITVGGAIAADVHGKNHHSEGSFSRHLHSLKLMSANGTIYNCNREENSDIFWATCGGMGLTGLIVEATFQMKPVETAYIVEDSIRVRNIDELFPLFEESLHYTYSVAWIDCLAKGNALGRGILLNGEHATKDDLSSEAQKANPLQVMGEGKLSLPDVFPSFTINPATTKIFNHWFYSKGNQDKFTHLTDYDTYYYPLDGVLHWNRVYGKKGFAQYQFVIPPKNAYDGLVRILEKIAHEPMPSFLTVLKTFGPGDPGLMSFPMEGYTLALDFPITQRLWSFLDELDEIVLAYGGRLYLTKDSRMKPEMLRAGYDRLDDFLAIKHKIDGGNAFQSMQSRRLDLG